MPTENGHKKPTWRVRLRIDGEWFESERRYTEEEADLLTMSLKSLVGERVTTVLPEDGAG